LENHEAFKHRNEKETCTHCGLHLSASSLKKHLKDKKPGKDIVSF